VNNKNKNVFGLRIKLIIKNKKSDKMSSGSGFGGAVVFLALGIACIVMTAPSYKYPIKVLGVDTGLTRPARGDPPICGADSFLSVPDWLFGTGIAYLIIGASMSIFALILLCVPGGAILLMIIWIVSGFFVLAWGIIGGISLWKYGSDCIDKAFLSSLAAGHGYRDYHPHHDWRRCVRNFHICSK
jgi:hypothetical protein